MIDEVLSYIEVNKTTHIIQWKYSLNPVKKFLQLFEDVNL